MPRYKTPSPIRDTDKPIKRRRCRYCDNLFPIPDSHPDKKFCCDRHRITFNNDGLALGPLREKLPKWITIEVAKQLAAVEARLMAAMQSPSEG